MKTRMLLIVGGIVLTFSSYANQTQSRKPASDECSKRAVDVARAVFVSNGVPSDGIKSIEITERGGSGDNKMFVEAKSKDGLVDTYQIYTRMKVDVGTGEGFCIVWKVELN